MFRKIAWLTFAIVVIALAASVRPDLDPAELEQKYAAAPSRFAEIGHWRVHYRDEGQGAPIVLVHGTTSSLHTWNGWAARLKQDHRVLRMDLPAFGLTGPSPDPDDYTIDGYVRFVEAFVDHLGLKRFILAGNSLGGYIAWRYTLEHPEQIRALGLLDAAGYPREDTPMLIRLGQMPVIRQLLPWITPRMVVAWQVRTAYGQPERVTPEVVDRYYELLLRAGNRRAYRDYVDRIQLGDQWERIREITAPTLIQWGYLDHLIPVAHADRFASDIAGSVKIIYTDAGHIPMEEIPERSVQDFAAFVAQLDDTRAPAAAPVPVPATRIAGAIEETWRRP